MGALVGALLLVLAPTTVTALSIGRLANVLLIIVDDLRPELGCYGASAMRLPNGSSTTPHIDALAQQGALFERAFVQQSICGPSRNSFLSGRYPDKTKSWNFDNSFRDSAEGKKWTALPEFFRRHGFFTTGAGKAYHPNLPPKFDGNRSWSEPWDAAGTRACNCPLSPGVVMPKPGQGQASCEGLVDNGCMDDDIVDIVTTKLWAAANGTLGNGSQPFFIVAGLHKPHMPFYAPQKFFDLYPEPAVPVPRLPPVDSPMEAWHSCLGHAPEAAFSDWGNFTDISNNSLEWQTPMSEAVTARLRRGYYAATSYADANVGKLLAELEATGQANNTAVVLLGDHGFNLGEGNLVCSARHALGQQFFVLFIVRLLRRERKA